MKRRNGQAGYTLLELLLVLSILGVLAAALLPGVNKLYRRYELDAASREVVADIRQTQMSAWAHQDVHELKFARFAPRYTHWEAGLYRGQKRLPERIGYRHGYLDSSVSSLLFDPNHKAAGGSIRLVSGSSGQAEIKLLPVSGHVVYEGVRP
jgi:prepilin-type N-terminal cleavage/methylation domain-containing protein